MYRLFYLLSLALLLVAVIPAAAQDDNAITCPDGTEILNGVEILVNVRRGFPYTATAIGIDDFDPVIAVRNGRDVLRCADDSRAAADYQLDLPTTGQLSASETSAQLRLPFPDNGEGFATLSLIVGDYNNRGGEFVFILEGMAVTGADGAGDPFMVNLTPEIVAAGVPLTVYMLSLRNDLDPLIELVDEDANIIVLDDGTRVSCDDAGDSSSCFDESNRLDSSFVGETRGGERDAMLSLPVQALQGGFEDSLSLAYLMTSFERGSSGDYLVAFHMGIGSATPSGNGEGRTPLESEREGVVVDYGVEVVCPNGVVISNGVELITDFKPGETYTATAVGIRAFNPAIAVISPDGDIQCEDDTGAARSYAVNLPTAGTIAASANSAQLSITHSAQTRGQYAFIVGDANGGSGEFVLLIEGGELSDDEGRADPFVLRLSPNVQSAPITPSVYMFATDNTLDPYLEVVDETADVLRLNGSRLDCDDAGDDSLCFGETEPMTGVLISAGTRKVRGQDTSALLMLPEELITSASVASVVATSYNQESLGGYLMAFHIGVAPIERDSESNI